MERKKNILIKPEFFSERIKVNLTKMYPMVVMATMSSGKSTLINALLDADILPNENAACTAKVYSILDDDTITVPTVYITLKNGDVRVVTDRFSEELEVANGNDDVTDILISGQVKGVLNTNKSLLVIDTPGPNNSGDEEHAKIMKNVLENVLGGLIVYVINVTQMGIFDDQELLSYLKKYQQNNENVDVVFVLNKMDQLDYERESAEEYVLGVRAYLEENNFHNPEIIPISALAGSLFKKTLREEVLTRKQFRDFEDCFGIFRSRDLRMQSLAITGEDRYSYQFIDVRGERYKRAEIEAALENTGIPYLEKYIQNKQIRSTGVKKVRISVKKRVEGTK